MRIVALMTMILALAAGGAAAAGHLVLGGEDEDEAILLDPRQLAEGPDGMLYALDAGDAVIRVFSPAGEHLRDLAGRGEGPGEFQRIDGASFGFTPAGRIYFTEYFGGHRWITVLEPDGDLVATIAPELPQAYGIEAAWPLPEGRFLVQFSLSQVVEATGDVYLYRLPKVLRVMDEQGKLGPEIIRTEDVRLISVVPDGATLTLPFLPAFAWAVTGAGEVLWGDGLSPRLRVFDLEGRPREPLTTPLPPAPRVTDQDLDRWRTNLADRMRRNAPEWWHRFGRAADEYTEALYPRPVLADLSLTAAGEILVRGRPAVDDERIPYWLLDADGALLAHCLVPAGRLVIGARHLLFFTEEEDGRRLAHALARPPGEARPLAQLEAFFAGN